MLHDMQTWSSDENSVCLSNVWIVTKCEEKYVQIFIGLPYERSFSIVFREKNGWWGRPLLPEILGQPTSVGAKLPIVN